MSDLDPELAAVVDDIQSAGVPEWHRISVASARRVEDRVFADLPEATVVTAGHDPLRDEGRAYVDALDSDGTPVEHHHYPSMAHGFLSLTDSVGVAHDAMDALAAELRASLS